MRVYQDSRIPFWYIDKDRLQEFALKERERMIEELNSKIDEFSTKYFYQCNSCGKIYTMDELFEVNYGCPCDKGYIVLLDEYPEVPRLRFALAEMKTEVV
jgi:transcription initiation factor IIE alpha subunit